MKQEPERLLLADGSLIPLFPTEYRSTRTSRAEQNVCRFLFLAIQTAADRLGEEEDDNHGTAKTVIDTPTDSM